MKTIHRVAPLLILAATVSACSDDDGASYPTYAASTADTMLLPFKTAAGELKLFDPAAPDATPATLESGLPLPTFGVAGIGLVRAGSYDAASNTLTDSHNRFAWYSKDGALYRVDLLNTASHTPVQFSSFDDVCGTGGQAIDYADPLNTLIVVVRAGVDTDCSTDDDNIGHLVTLGASTADDGIAMPPTSNSWNIFEAVQAANGGVQRLIFADFGPDRRLLSYAPDLSSGTTLTALQSSGAPFLFDGPDPSRTQKYFRLKPGGATLSSIYRYDAAGDNLTLLHAHTSSAAGFIVADDDYLYFNDAFQIYRVAHSATVPEPLHDAGGTISGMELTIDRIILNFGSVAIESLPKTGGSRTRLSGSDLTPGKAIIATAGAYVYYGHIAAETVAYRVRQSGGSVSYADARWVAELVDPDVNLGRIESERITRTLLLAQADDAGVWTVRPVDARSAVRGPVLGAIADVVSGFGLGIGRYLMLKALILRAPGQDDYDVYFVDIQAAGSLHGAATTADLDDSAP